MRYNRIFPLEGERWLPESGKRVEKSEKTTRNICPKTMDRTCLLCKNVEKNKWQKTSNHNTR